MPAHQAGTGKNRLVFYGIQADPALQLPLQWIDVVVEGRFIEALRDTQLRFRGSPNQRIVDVAASKGKAIPVELTEYY